jgi:predicted Zn-dependent protease
MDDNKTATANGSGSKLQAVFDQMAEKIIEQQETIIGPLAIERAKLVDRLKVDWSQHSVSVSGDHQAAIDELVTQYKELFGQIAVETCKEAAARFTSQLSPEQLPRSLK